MDSSSNLERLEELTRELQQIKTECDQFFHMVPDLVFIAERHHYVKVNRAFQRKLGWNYKEVVGHHWREFAIAEDRDRTTVASDTVFDRELELFRFQNRMKKKDGGSVQVSWTVSKPDERGRVYGVGHILGEKGE